MLELLKQLVLTLTKLRDTLKKQFPITPTPMPPTPTPPEVPQSPYLWDKVANVRNSIRVIGDEFGFSPHMKDLLCDIARCESGFDPNAKRTNSPKSIDRGLYQWNSLYHPDITDAIAYNPEKNTRLACVALKQRKAHTYWSASEPCWNIKGRYDDIL